MDNRPIEEIIATGNVDTIIEVAVEYYDGRYGEDNRYKAACLYENALTLDPKNARAINNLGNCYNNGIGVNKDHNKAKELYRQSAEMGFVNAQYNLADSLKSESDPECIEWYQKAHINGDEDAAYILSSIYKDGIIVPPDVDLMIHYLKEASQIGNHNATLDLACEYMQGESIPKDKAEGAALMKNAAEAGNGIAAGNMALMHVLGDGVEKNKDLAIKWAKKAADLGEPTRLVDIATDIYNGDGCDEDKTEAVTLFEYASKCGSVIALENLGVCYFNGFGVPKNDNKEIYYYERAALQGSKKALDNLEKVYDSITPEETAAKMFDISNKAADAGNSDAYIRLHFHYKNGDVVEKDFDIAKKYLDMALDANNTMAYYLAGNYCFTGDFQTEKDIPKGIRFWEKAIDLGGSGEMPRIIGDFYRLGQGIEVNYHKSIEWYEKAKELSGDAQACFWLGMLYGGAVDDSIVDYEKSAENYELAHEAGITAATACLADCYAGGIGVKKDEHRAFELNKSAAESGFGLSMFKVFQAYHTGTGVEKDVDEGQKWLDKAVEKGEPAACELQGKVHFHLQEYEKAFPLLEIASNAGSAVSSTLLADFFRYGAPGIEKDEERAFLLYKEAAQKGYPEAQWKLGQCYGIGEGCEIDYEASREWLVKASANGVVEARALLATMYELGIGVEKDTDLAISLYRDVIKHGTGEVVDDAIKSLEALTYDDEKESLPSNVVDQIKRADLLLVNQAGVMDAADAFNSLAESTGDLYCAFKAFLTNANLISSDLHMMKNGLNIMDHSIVDADNVIRWAVECKNESNKLAHEYEYLFRKYEGLAYRIKGSSKFLDYPDASVDDLRKAVENGDNPSRLLLIFALNKELSRLASTSNFDLRHINRLSTEIINTANEFVDNYNDEESEPGDLGGAYEVLSSFYEKGIGTEVNISKSQKYKKLAEKCFEKQPDKEDLSKYTTEELMDKAVSSTSYYSKNIGEIDEVLQNTTRKQFRERYIFDISANKKQVKTINPQKNKSVIVSDAVNNQSGGNDKEKSAVQTVSSFFGKEDIPPQRGNKSEEGLDRAKHSTEAKTENNADKQKQVNNNSEEKTDKRPHKKKDNQKKTGTDTDTYKKIKKTIIFGLIGIAIIIAVIVAAKALKPIVSPFKYDNVPSASNSAGNTESGTKVAIQGSTAYYVKDFNSHYEDDEGEEYDHTYDVALYSSDINGKNEQTIYTSDEDVESAILSINDNKAYILEKLIVDYESEDHQRSRVTAVDLSSGEKLLSFEPDLIDINNFFILNDKIYYVWYGWSGEDALECISTTNLDGEDLTTLYETTGNFEYTWNNEKLYIADTIWDYDNDIGKRIILSLKLSDEEKAVLFEEKLQDTNSYWDGMYISENGLILTEVLLPEEDDYDEYAQHQLMVFNEDASEFNVISEWEESAYASAYGSNAYSNYYYFNYYNENRQKYELRRTNISTGDTEKVLDIPDVPYVEGPSVEVLLYEKCIVLNMKEMDFDDNSYLATDKNRVFVYDLNGKEKAEL